MAVMDEFREERASLRTKPLKARLQWFWEYYKWWVIGIGVAIIAIVSFIHSVVTSKDDALFGYIFNTYAAETDALYEQYGEYIEMNPDKTQVTVESSQSLDLNSYDQNTTSMTQAVMVHIAAGDLDLFGGDDALIRHYGYNETFADLRDLLDADFYDELATAGRVWYVDRAVVRYINEQEDAGNYEAAIPYPPDPYDPASMDEPVPVAVNMVGVPKFDEYFASPDGGPRCFAAVVSSNRLDNTADFIYFMFGKPRPPREAIQPATAD